MQANLFQGAIASLLIPVPPLEEQERIVGKLNQILPLVDEYEKMEKQLVALKEGFPKILRDALLQAAFKGELSSREEDSPVKDLMQSIDDERNKMIKEGKYKINSKLDERESIPYDIPDEWKWTKFGLCTTYGQKVMKNAKRDNDSNLWSLDLEDIEKDTGRIIKKYRVGERAINGDRTYFHKGDLLYSKLRPYLQKMLIADEEGVCSPELIPFQTLGAINKKYVLWLLKSPSVDYEINSSSYGVKMPRVNTETMINLMVPLPPIEEQERIVEMLDYIIPLCEQLLE